MATSATIPTTAAPPPVQDQSDPYPLSPERKQQLSNMVDDMMSHHEEPNLILDAVKAFKQKNSSTGQSRALGDIERNMSVDTGKAFPKSDSPLALPEGAEPAQPIIPVQRALEVGSEPGLAPKLQAASMIGRGALAAVSPIAIPAAAITAPAALAGGVVGGTAAGVGTHAALEDADIPQGYKDVAEDAAGLAGGAAGGWAGSKLGDLTPIVKAVLQNKDVQKAAVGLIPKGKEGLHLLKIVKGVADDLKSQRSGPPGLTEALNAAKAPIASEKVLTPDETKSVFGDLLGPSAKPTATPSTPMDSIQRLRADVPPNPNGPMGTPAQTIERMKATPLPEKATELTTPKTPDLKEHYQPTNRATNNRIVPTPAELGTGVFSKSGPDSAANVRVLASENEKAFNIADYAFQNGIKDPRLFDAMDSELRQRVTDEALEHGKTVGNAVPRTGYNSPINGTTAELAKLHLQRMVDNEAAGKPAVAKSEKPAEEDLTTDLQRSIEELRQKNQRNK